MASVRLKIDTLKLLPQEDAGKGLCAMVPPLPTYNIVSVQVMILSAGRWLDLTTVAGPVQSVKKSPKIPTHKRNDEFGKPCPQCRREFGVRVTPLWVTRVLALIRVIALRCKWEQPWGRRGKEPRLVLIDIKSDKRVHPQPVRGNVGQKILHKIQMVRSAGRCIDPEDMAGSGVDCGDSGSGPMCWFGSHTAATIPCLPKLLPTGRCVESAPAAKPIEPDMLTGVRDQRRLDP